MARNLMTRDFVVSKRVEHRIHLSKSFPGSPPCSTPSHPATVAPRSEKPSRTPRSLASEPAPPSTTSSGARSRRSEEHTSELQSRQYLVCRLLLEKKKHTSKIHQPQFSV